MEADRHKIWGIVRNNYASLDEAAPEGHSTVVDVFLVARADPIRVSEVHTSQAIEFPWTLFANEAWHEGSPSPDARIVLTPEQFVERVEIHYEPSTGEQVGFSHQVLEEKSPSGGP